MLILLLAAAPVDAAEDAAGRARRLYGEAVEAMENREFDLARRHLEEAAVLRPHHPTLILKLAEACALAGDPDAARARLRLLVAMGIDAEPGESFASLEGLEGIRQGFAHNRMPVGRSATTFRVRGETFIPEGLAYDPRDDAFFLGSVREGRILRVQGDTVQEFAGPHDGLWSVFGMRVDAEARHLWVCTTAAPQFRNLEAGDRGAAALLRFDLEGSRPPLRWERRTPGVEHWFGDLDLGPGGEVYLTDGGEGSVLVLHAGADSLRNLVPAGALPSPQGIAASAAGRVYLADYSRGLFSVDPASGDLGPVPYPSRATLLGIDGLVLYGNELIAIQNGIRPHRVVRARLSRDGERITSVETFLANLEGWSEPTLGVVVDDVLHYVANSQWWALDGEGALDEDAELEAPRIMNAPLGKPASGR